MKENARLSSSGNFKIQFGTKTISLYFLIESRQEQKYSTSSFIFSKLIAFPFSNFLNSEEINSGVVQTRVIFDLFFQIFAFRFVSV